MYVFLNQVEAALTTDPDNDELIKLKQDLQVNFTLWLFLFAGKSSLSRLAFECVVQYFNTQKSFSGQMHTKPNDCRILKLLCSLKYSWLFTLFLLLLLFFFLLQEVINLTLDLLKVNEVRFTSCMYSIILFTSVNYTLRSLLKLRLAFR